MKTGLLLLLLLSSLFSRAADVIKIPQGPLDLENFPLYYFIDKDNNLTIDDLQALPFSKATSRKAFGYQKHKTVWFKFTLYNPQEDAKELLIYHKEGYTYIDTIFYKLKDDTVVGVQDISRRVPLKDRLIKDPSPTYKLTLSPRETATIYIKNYALSSIMCNIQILDSQTHKRAHLIKSLLYTFMFGILFALVLYNAFLFLSIRHSEYFFYVIFIIASASYLLYLSGLPLELFDFNEHQYKNLLYGVSILQIALFFFSKKVLETRAELPRLHNFISFMTLIPALLFCVGIFYGIDTILSIQAAFAMLSALALMVIGIIAFKHKIPEAKYYLLSIGLYLLFALIGIFTFFGLLPYNNVTRNALFFASISEVFLLSLLLSYRIGILRQRAIESEKRLHDEVRSHNLMLKTKVNERTEELNKLNKNLESKIHLAVSQIRKKDEDLLRQSRMAMMGEMLSMIAHQWKQPLATIVSVKNTMQVQIALGELEEKRLLSQLNDIDGYVQYMSKTVDDFSGFFRPNKRKQSFLITDLLETSLLMMKTSFSESHISIKRSFKAEKKLLNFKNELLQVFLNILKNAQDAFKENSVEKPTVKVKIKEFPDRQEISFEDNAGGIDPSIINKIFDPYFSTKEEKNGTGLGLYMSQTIIKEHCQGSIDARNKNEGALFTITLYFDNDRQVL